MTVKVITGTPPPPALGIINIVDYGAVADSNGTTSNGTDNQGAIAAAVAAAQANGSGAVYVPPSLGKYFRYTGQIAITASNVSLFGAGMGVSRLYCDNTAGSQFGSIQAGTYGPTAQLTGVRIADLTLKANQNAAAGANAQGISLVGCVHSSIRFCEVDSANSISIVVDGGHASAAMSGYITIESNFVHNSVADGIKIDGCLGAVVANNLVHDTGDDGISVSYEYYSQDVAVTGNTVIRPGSRGIAIMGGPSPNLATTWTQNVTVAGNTVEQSWLAGIYCECSQGSLVGVSITGNTVTNAGNVTPPSGQNARGVGVAAGILVNASSASRFIYGVTISGNSIYNPQNGHIWVGNDFHGSTTAGGGAQYVKVVGNTCANIAAVGGKGAAAGTGTGNSQSPSPAKYPGIAVQNAQDCQVSDNHIVNVYHEAVYVGPSCTGVIQVDGTTANIVNTSATAGLYGVNMTTGQDVALNNTIRDVAGNATGAVTITGTAVTNANNARVTV